MFYTRGSADDFDRFAEVSGDEGWSWDNIQPYLALVRVLDAMLKYFDIDFTFRSFLGYILHRMRNSFLQPTTTTSLVNSIPPCTISTVRHPLAFQASRKASIPKFLMPLMSSEGYSPTTKILILDHL